MLSSSEIQRYHQDGFVIPDFRLDEETLEQIRSDHERLLKKHPEFVNYCPNVLAYDLSFLNYARIPGILDLVESVLGPDFAFGTRVFLPNLRERAKLPPGIRTVNIGLSGLWPPARSGLQSMLPTLKMDAFR